jgi:hypothetical protein
MNSGRASRLAITSRRSTALKTRFGANIRAYDGSLSKPGGHAEPISSPGAPRTREACGIELRAAPPRIALQDPSYARPSARTSTAETECADAPPSGPVPIGRHATPMCVVRARVRRESPQSGAQPAASGASGSAPGPAPPSFASDPKLCHAWAARAVRPRDEPWRGRWR